MKTVSKYLLMTFVTLLMVTMYSCDDQEEIEYNIPGKWYTEKEIDFRGDAWGRGTVLSFNDNYEGYIGSAGDDRNNLFFQWRWMSPYSYDTTMELYFPSSRTYAYIECLQSTHYTFSGIWYNDEDELIHGEGQSFTMHRVLNE